MKCSTCGHQLHTCPTCGHTEERQQLRELTHEEYRACGRAVLVGIPLGLLLLWLSPPHGVLWATVLFTVVAFAFNVPWTRSGMRKAWLTFRHGRRTYPQDTPAPKETP